MRGQWEFIQCTLYINKSCSTPQLKYFVNKIKRGTPPNIWMGNSTETLSTSTYIGTYTWLRWQNDRRVMSLMTVTVMLLADRVNKRNEKSQKKKNQLNDCCWPAANFFFFSSSFSTCLFQCIGLQMSNRAIRRNYLWCLGGTLLYGLPVPNEGLEILEKRMKTE